MQNRSVRLSRALYRVPIAMGFALARLFRLCQKIEFNGIGVSLIPGLITCNISFRAGGSGRAHCLWPILRKKKGQRLLLLVD